MISQLPQGLMNPELTKLILFNFNRTRRFQNLNLALKKEKLQPQPDRERIQQLRETMRAMYPECFATAVKTTRRVATWGRRVAEMPYCFCTPARSNQA